MCMYLLIGYSINTLYCDCDVVYCCAGVVLVGAYRCVCIY